MEGARLYSFIAAFTDPEGSDSPDALMPYGEREISFTDIRRN